MGSVSCWRKLIADVADGDEILHCTLDDAGLDKEFNCSYGCHEGEAFTAWSKDYVYFPVVYDGAEWVGRVPRKPCKEVTKHVGLLGGW